MKKALVCGAGGFIGNHLVTRLKKEGCWVRGVDIKRPEFSKTKADEFVVGDLRNVKVCEKILNQAFDRVYQLAADMGGAGYLFTGENDASVMHNSAMINLNIAEQAKKMNVKKLFYSSSACIYPKRNQLDSKNPNCSEDSAYPADPDSEYGWEKLFSERMYKAYEKDCGLEVRIARFFNIYGPECLIDTKMSKAPMALTRKVIEAGNNGSVKIWGDGKQVRSFCFISDCVEAIYKLMESEINEPLNIGTSDHLSIDELVDIICKIEGVKITKVHQLNKTQGVRGRLCDYSKAKKLLKWQAKVTPMEGMEQICKFVHKQLNKKNTKK